MKLTPASPGADLEGGVGGARPPPFCHKNTLHLCLDLEAPKSLHHGHAHPPFQNSWIRPCDSYKYEDGLLQLATTILKMQKIFLLVGVSHELIKKRLNYFAL